MTLLFLAMPASGPGLRASVSGRVEGIFLGHGPLRVTTRVLTFRVTTKGTVRVTMRAPLKALSV